MLFFIPSHKLRFYSLFKVTSPTNAQGIFTIVRLSKLLCISVKTTDLWLYARKEMDYPLK